MLKDLPARLTSRKLWLAIGGFITLFASNHINEAVMVLLAYLGVEGANDVASTVKS